MAWHVSLIMLAVVGAMSGAAGGDVPAPSSIIETPDTPTLGIGFLWTAQSRHMADQLTTSMDFADLLLSEGRLDVFEQVKPPARVACIALAVERHAGRPFRGMKETIELLRLSGIAPDRVILAYNPERAPGTPAHEIDELLASVQRAREMAKAYGAPLMVGPGLRDMLQREHLYPELAQHCDMWLIQSQRLQLDAATRRPVDLAQYRQGVQRIVELLRQGNPDIQIVVQIVTTAERGTVILSAEQIAATAMAIEDLVDAARIYGASGELLDEVIGRLRAPRTASPQGPPSAQGQE